MVRVGVDWGAYDYRNVCPKCGGSTHVEHVPPGADVSEGSWAHGVNHDYPKFREHMRRACNTCSYVWFEKPLDDD